MLHKKRLYMTRWQRFKIKCFEFLLFVSAMKRWSLCLSGLQYAFWQHIFTWTGFFKESYYLFDKSIKLQHISQLGHLDTSKVVVRLKKFSPIDQENTFQLPFSFNVIDSDLRGYPQSLVTIIGLLNDKYYQIINALARLWPLELSRVQKAQGSTFSGGLLQIMQCLVSIIS